MIKIRILAFEDRVNFHKAYIIQLIEYSDI